MSRQSRLFSCLIMALFLCIPALSSCAKQPQQDDRKTVITTVFATYDFARQIVGDSMQVSLLLSPGAESHTYEPTPQDMIAIQNCDLFIYIGGESEAWVERLLRGSDTKDGKTLRLMDYVNLLHEETVEGMQTEEHGTHEEDAHEEELDEHIWTSPKVAMQMVDAIYESLCEAVPESSALFHANTEAYQKQLQLLDQTFSDIVSAADTDTIIFADRFPCRYFTHTYGLQYYAAFPGCADDAEPSAATLTFLIDKVSETSIPVVFYTEFSNQKIADTICEETGAEKRLFHSCHNVTKTEMESGATYLSLMQQNAENLKEALIWH